MLGCARQADQLPMAMRLPNPLVEEPCALRLPVYRIRVWVEHQRTFEFHTQGAHVGKQG